MKKLFILFILAMSIFGASIARANLIVNGDFSQPNIGTNPWEGFGYSSIDSTSIPGWTVSNVDIVNTTYYQAAPGANQSLDLNGNASGWILQTFTTTPGQAYGLTFELAGNPLGSGPAVKVLNVVGSFFIPNVSFDTTGHSATNMGWENVGYEFIAVGTTTALEFQSMTGGDGGAALDDISVDPVPEPSTLLLLGAGLLGVGFLRKRALK
jgi:choice-of-anchor C domain-containing protein